MFSFISFATIAAQQQRCLKCSLLKSNNALKMHAKKYELETRQKGNNKRTIDSKRKKKCYKRKEILQRQCTYMYIYTYVSIVLRSFRDLSCQLLLLFDCLAQQRSSIVHISFSLSALRCQITFASKYSFLLHSFTVAGYLFALLLYLSHRNHLIYCNFLSSRR